MEVSPFGQGAKPRTLQRPRLGVDSVWRRANRILACARLASPDPTRARTRRAAAPAPAPPPAAPPPPRPPPPPPPGRRAARRTAEAPPSPPAAARAPSPARA